jgi:hypothetical protein
VQFQIADFNGAGKYFDEEGSAEWDDLEQCVTELPMCLQASDQRGKVGDPIFDPKATNAFLTAASQARGWHKIPVPNGLTEFGTDWDGGKNETLAEWQFSNYPFLWNNVIRSEGVWRNGTRLNHMKLIKALVVVTKSGLFPASNSTLYFEQARAQLQAATSFSSFEIPIRLVGLFIQDEVDRVTGRWTEYSARYSRDGITDYRTFDVSWGRPGKYGNPRARFSVV